MKQLPQIDQFTQPEALPQILAFAFAVALALLLRASLTLRLRQWRTQTSHKIRAALLEGLQNLLPVLTPLIALLFVGMAETALEQEALPIFLFQTGKKILIVWLAIEVIWRFSSNSGTRVFLVGTLAGTLTLDMLDLLRPTISWMQKLSYSIGGINISLYGIISAIVALVALLWIARLFDRGMDKVLLRIHMRGSTRQLITKTINVILYCVVGMFALSILGVDITTLTVFSGAVGVGIGFGLQKIASNFISGIILLMEKSVEVNDVILLNDGKTGRIRLTGARYTLVDTEDGRAHMIPNEQFITSPVINLTHLGKRGKVDVQFFVDYGTDLRRAREIILARMKSDSRILENPAPSCNITTLDKGSVTFACSYWLPDITQHKGATMTELYAGVMEDFHSNNIALPQSDLAQLAKHLATYSGLAVAEGANSDA
jgi:small-conductance mechanosensitive channel